LDCVSIINKNVPALKSSQMFEGLILIPPVKKLGGGGRRSWQLRQTIPEPDELVGVIVGQGLKQDAVHYRKDCGVGAYAQRQRDYSDAEKERLLDHHASCITQVLD